MGTAIKSNRLIHAWNAFVERDKHPNSELNGISKTSKDFFDYGSYHRIDRKRLTLGNEKSIVSAVYTQLAIDVSAVGIRHVRVNENDSFVSVIRSPLNDCLTVEANVDQTGRELIFDIAMSMFDEGYLAVVPVETSNNLLTNGSYDIYQLRTASIIEWKPRRVKVRLYNDRTGKKEEIYVPKDKVAIIENPFYSVMNETNSTLKRLTHKLNLLDAVDDQSSSSKLDLIIQLPYVVKSKARMEQANERRHQIEEQLSGSKYGIAYIDGTERVTQLNRSVENNLMGQIEYLTSMLYSQLGLSQAIFDGTANEQQMLNYYNRTIEPILSAIVDEMKRKFLTKTARTQGQSIKFFRDPFKLVSVNQIADIADKFTRNEVMSPNEMRGVVGLPPSGDASSDELRNRNLNPPTMDTDSSGQMQSNQTSPIDAGMNGVSSNEKPLNFNSETPNMVDSVPESNNTRIEYVFDENDSDSQKTHIETVFDDNDSETTTPSIINSKHLSNVPRYVESVFDDQSDTLNRIERIFDKQPNSVRIDSVFPNTYVDDIFGDVRGKKEGGD